MKKLRVAIIGQGRSGRNIHGKFFLSELNKNFDVVAVVDAIEYRREKAIREFGCKAFAAVEELYAIKDEIDLVTNASFSYMHYPLTKELLEHGMNIVVEKPFGANYNEAMDLIETAKKNNAQLFVFQQSLLPDNIEFMKNVITSGKIGDLVALDAKYNGFSHRYDWQTLQCFVAGGLYNTAPHPIGVTLYLLGCDWKDVKLVYSDLRCINAAGDSDDYARIILKTPNGAIGEVEVSNLDLTNPINYKIQGTMGSLTMSVGGKYTLTYTLPEEQDIKPLHKEPLADENGDPIYCQENVIRHTEEGEVNGDGFEVGTARFYNYVYETMVNGAEFPIKPEDIAHVVRIIDEAHCNNPLEKKYSL